MPCAQSTQFTAHCSQLTAAFPFLPRPPWIAWSYCLDRFDAYFQGQNLALGSLNCSEHLIFPNKYRRWHLTQFWAMRLKGYFLWASKIILLFCMNLPKEIPFTSAGKEWGSVVTAGHHRVRKPMSWEIEQEREYSSVFRDGIELWICYVNLYTSLVFY